MRILWAALAALCVAAPAAAQDCNKPLQKLLSLDLEPIGDSGRMLVPVSMNGVPMRLLLNTGAGLTFLTQATVDTLKLKPTESRMKLLDTAGNASSYYVRLDSFQLGNMQTKDFPLMVAPNPSAEKLPYDGMMAGDLLYRFDIEMDFTGHKLNYFLTDHCPGRVIYWPHTAIAVVPFTMNRPVRMPVGFGQLDNSHDTHIRVPVTLNGKDFRATISTGGFDSTMSAATAKYIFGITADSPGSVTIGMANKNPAQKIFTHVFDTLTFDGVTVTNPSITVVPDLMGSKDPNNDLQTGSHIAHVDDGLGSEVSIGMNVLRRLHLFIAYSEGKLYITPADQPAQPAR